MREFWGNGKLTKDMRKTNWRSHAFIFHVNHVSYQSRLLREPSCAPKCGYQIEKWRVRSRCLLKRPSRLCLGCLGGYCRCRGRLDLAKVRQRIVVSDVQNGHLRGKS